MNLYLRYFDSEILVSNVEEAIDFLAGIDEIGMNDMLDGHTSCKQKRADALQQKNPRSGLLLTEELL